MEYEHIVYFTVKDGRSYIAIDYLFSDRRRSFQTHHELPDIANENEGYELMSKVAEWLGNSLLISTPGFRNHIGIEEGEE